MTRVLVVDDEPQILRALRINLAARSYDVVTAADGRQALAAAAKALPDIVVLDLGLPDMDGIDVIRGLRGWTATPIIILSGRSQSAAKVDALDAGADDYVTKPFNIDELLARLRAVTHRVPVGDDTPCVRIGNYLVDLQAHRVTSAPTTTDAQRPPVDLHLTPTEWQLLEQLIRNPGQAGQPAGVAADDLGAEVRRRDPLPPPVHGPAQTQAGTRPCTPRHLLTELGMGYRYQP